MLRGREGEREREREKERERWMGGREKEWSRIKILIKQDFNNCLHRIFTEYR